MNGKLLRKLRKEKNLTQQELANLLNVDLSSIGKWEIHDFTPNKTTLFQLADHFVVSVDYLLGRTAESIVIPQELHGVGISLTPGFTQDDIDDVKNYVEYVRQRRMQKHDK